MFSPSFLIYIYSQANSSLVVIEFNFQSISFFKKKKEEEKPLFIVFADGVMPPNTIYFQQKGGHF
jgi:hypothetical protein